MKINYKQALIALAISCALLLTALIILVVRINNVKDENRKLNAILDMSCDYSGNIAQCRQGINMLKGMSLEDIKKGLSF